MMVAPVAPVGLSGSPLQLPADLPQQLPFRFEVASPESNPDSAPARETFVLRPLQKGDFALGFGALLAQLSDVGDLDGAKFDEILERNEASLQRNDAWGVRTLVVVHEVEHQENGTENRKIVCSASLLFEQKFLRGGKKVGHVEDVVCDQNYRKRGLAKRVIQQLLGEAKQKKDVYKVILDCTEANSAVYAKMGFFVTGEVQMRVNL